MKQQHPIVTITSLFGLFFMLGGSFSYIDESLPNTMNPLFGTRMVDHRVHELVFDRLFYRAPLTNSPTSRLVGRAEPLDNGKKLKLLLKSGITWHDGEPFGPDDVCFTIAAMLNPETPASGLRQFRDTLVGCESLSRENAAVIEFKKAYHNPKDRLSFAILPAHKFASSVIEPDNQFSSRPIGTGPMKGVKSLREVSFTKYKNAHHDAQVPSMKMIESADPYVQVANILNGQNDGIINVSPNMRSKLMKSDEAALTNYDLRSWWFVAVNTNHKALKVQKIRQALNYTLDRIELRKLALGVDPGAALPPCEFISGPFVPSSSYYFHQVEEVQRADSAKARQLMIEAGAVWTAGTWTYNGEPITINLGMKQALSRLAPDLLDQIGNQLQKGGFQNLRFKVRDDDWDRKVLTGESTGEYDLLIGNWSFGVVDEVNAQFNTRTGDKGFLNIFNYSNPTVDGLLNEFTVAVTDTQARDAYQRLHAYLAEDLPYLFLWKLDTKSAWRNEVRGKTIAPYYYFSDFSGWRRD